jgi:hypothetical protein
MAMSTKSMAEQRRIDRRGAAAAMTAQQRGEIIMQRHRMRAEYEYARGLLLARVVVWAGTASLLGFVLWSIAR